MNRRTALAAALLAATTAVRLISMTWLRALAWDEVEFFRVTDRIRHGFLPYRDVWEHHSPLQWFLFAPFTSFVHGAGASAIVAMRWMQLPLWIAGFVLIGAWARRQGVSATAIVAAATVTLASPFFCHWALQYRVDAAGCAFFIAGLAAIQRAERHWAFAVSSGAAFALAGAANLRLAPLIVIAVVLAPVAARRARLTVLVWAGAIAVVGIALVYAFGTHSFFAAVEDVWRQNVRGDRDQPPQVGFFGVAAEGFFGRPADLAALAIAVVGAIGIARAIRLRGQWLYLAILVVAQVAFTALPKAIFPYHFMMLFPLLLPFVAREIDRLLAMRPQLVAAALAIVTAWAIYGALFFGQEADLRYQNAIMTAADRATPPGSRVFDGVGWAIRREPAYRHWFLPLMVRTLAAEGVLPSYDATQAEADPPAAIITDLRATGWLATHPSLARFASGQYLPLVRNLWLPGISASFAPGESCERIVPLTAQYAIYVSDRLAMHPWFASPLAVGGPESHAPLEVALRGFAPASQMPLRFFVDGAAQPPADVLTLRRGQRLRIETYFDGRVAMFIVPADRRFLFGEPGPGVTLDALNPPPPHLPRFDALR